MSTLLDQMTAVITALRSRHPYATLSDGQEVSRVFYSILYSISLFVDITCWISFGLLQKAPFIIYVTADKIELLTTNMKIQFKFSNKHEHFLFFSFFNSLFIPRFLYLSF